MSYILVYDALYLHWLHDVGDELRVSVGVSDLLMQQSSDAALHTEANTNTCHIFTHFIRHTEGGKKKTFTALDIELAVRRVSESTIPSWRRFHQGLTEAAFIVNQQQSSIHLQPV